MPPVPVRSFPLTAEELTLVCEIIGLGEPLGIGLLPLDHEDPLARELMLTTSLRSLAGRGLLRAGDADAVVLDAQLEATARLLSAPPVGVAVRLTDGASCADLTLAFDGDRAGVLAQRGLLDYDLYAFASVAPAVLLTYTLTQAFAGAPGGTIAAIRSDATGIAGEELAWSITADGVVEVRDAAEADPEPVTAEDLADRLLGAGR